MTKRELAVVLLELVTEMLEGDLNDEMLDFLRGFRSLLEDMLE